MKCSMVDIFEYCLMGFFFTTVVESLPMISLAVLNTGLTLLKQVAWTIRVHFISFSSFGFQCLCADCRSVRYPMLLCGLQEHDLHVLWAGDDWQSTVNFHSPEWNKAQTGQRFKLKPFSSSWLSLFAGSSEELKKTLGFACNLNQWARHCVDHLDLSESLSNNRIQPLCPNVTRR